jgi:2-polyprenyl-6-methoxyphenol hydroxylase-like FAD-dependent oxidoreductase
MPTTCLPPQFAALIDATTQIILQPIFDLESPRLAFGGVALIGDAAFVARPHVASGVMKAAIDAESLADALAGGGGVHTALDRYNATRQPYGAALVARGRHIGGYFASRDGDPRQRIETVMREYGAAGLVGGEPIAARSRT